MATFHAKFEPRNPEKYRGDVKNIQCRSSWEYFFCHHLDNNPEVISWASEEVIIPYWSPADNKNRRYYVDFVVRFKDGRIVLFEIKPHAQTLPPHPPKKNSAKAVERYNHEAKTFQVNIAKWTAAKDFAKRNSCEFVVFTENHLRQIGMPV